ncbi:MAG: hypothetical protein CME04_05630 [Gemmatimonadaceae bacterium]|jgi:hypothetical protein|nr:hypothetical protein [Gemmatimonadaceae bacterium]|tara:strand:+ start:64 stop:459 length:396 start_codon:yes stop_codon:yes gene_type:complete
MDLFVEHNIGPDGVRFRAFFGVLFFILCLGIMALLTVAGAPLILRLGVFLPAWICTLSSLQAAGGTCVFLAARGARTTELGTRRIEDDEERQYFARRAGRIQLQAIGSALLLTLLLVTVSVLIPWRLPIDG